MSVVGPLKCGPTTDTNGWADGRADVGNACRAPWFACAFSYGIRTGSLLLTTAMAYLNMQNLAVQQAW